MPKIPERVYWDSCVFLSLVSQHKERLPDILSLMYMADSGKLEILTSTYSIAEVAFASDEALGKPDLEAERRIKTLWLPSSPVQLVDFHALVAEGCRDLIRAARAKSMAGLKPGDGVHLATAQLIGVDEVHTYDAHLDKYAPLIGINICRPWVDQQTLDLRADHPGASAITPPSSPPIV